MAETAVRGALYVGRRVTREEFLDLPDDGHRYEQIDGVLHLVPPVFGPHGNAHYELVTLLKTAVDRVNARVYLDTFLSLPDDSPDLLGPDIAVLLADNPAPAQKAIEGVPDIVVEILSDSTAVRDAGVKSDRYLACGVKEYWLVDPRYKTIEVRYNTGGKWETQSGPSLESRVLDGLTVDAARLFR